MNKYHIYDQNPSIWITECIKLYYNISKMWIEYTHTYQSDIVLVTLYHNYCFSGLGNG